jgi:hypothetical protein
MSFNLQYKMYGLVAVLFLRCCLLSTFYTATGLLRPLAAERHFQSSTVPDFAACFAACGCSLGSAASASTIHRLCYVE